MLVFAPWDLAKNIAEHHAAGKRIDLRRLTREIRHDRSRTVNTALERSPKRAPALALARITGKCTEIYKLKTVD